MTIKSGGEALKEYEDPDRKIGDVKKNTTMYIEATSGSDYSICVYASPDSKFYEADSLQVHHVLDGHSAKHRHKVSEKLVTSAGGYAIHHETFLDATASNQKEKRIKFGALDAC